ERRLDGRSDSFDDEIVTPGVVGHPAGLLAARDECAAVALVGFNCDDDVLAEAAFEGAADLSVGEIGYRYGDRWDRPFEVEPDFARRKGSLREGYARHTEAERDRERTGGEGPHAGRHGSSGVGARRFHKLM